MSDDCLCVVVGHHMLLTRAGSWSPADADPRDNNPSSSRQDNASHLNVLPQTLMFRTDDLARRTLVIVRISIITSTSLR